MSERVQEYLLLPEPRSAALTRLDKVLSERGFRRASFAPPSASKPIARAEARVFDVHDCGDTVTLIREWNAYRDNVSWKAALELAQGLPPAARMETALPPALSILARALSRDGVAVGLATRTAPRQIVAVAFRRGRAADILTMADARIAVGATASPTPVTDDDARTELERWLSSHVSANDVVSVLTGERDLPSAWDVAYLHEENGAAMS